MSSNLAFGKTLVNSLRQIYFNSVLLFNHAMDIDEVRRANIKKLEAEAGSARAVADCVDMSYSQYINLRDGAIDPRSKKPRGMRKETAWRFEDAFNKPRGWLDQHHADYPASDASLAFVQQVSERVAHYAVPDHVRQTILMLIEQCPPQQAPATGKDKAKAA